MTKTLNWEDAQVVLSLVERASEGTFSHISVYVIFYVHNGVIRWKH